MGTSDRPGEQLEAKQFDGEVKDANFSNFRIEWCRGKEVIFNNCNFHSALIRFCYFHRAKFINCDFRGALFIDSNFRGATFDGCKFHYCQFKHTLIEFIELERNLPEWENCRRELLRNLRKNAESVGETIDARNAFKLEMESSMEHWRLACKKPSQYYKDHYKGIWKTLDAWRHRFYLTIGKYYWGYGESPIRLLVSIISTIFILSFIPSIDPITKLQTPLIVNFQGLLIALLTGNIDYLRSHGTIFIILFSIFRIISIGLLAATFLRRFARR